jgi:molybdopterin converting factor small subunit
MSPEAVSADSTAGHIRLRYWASARAAAGVAEDLLEVQGPVSLASLEARARDLHTTSASFSTVLGTCSVLLGDRPVASEHPDRVQVRPGQTVEFLPPFAGG